MSTIKRILCPTDFSSCANHAVVRALALAQRFDAELCLLHAVVLQGEYAVDPMSHFPSPEEIYDKVRRAAELEMTGLLAEHRDGPLQILKVVRRGFEPGAVILEYAEEHEVDLIVMGTHGRRGAKRFLLGSVAEEVVRHASCPVLTLREPKTPRKPKPIGTIVAPVDFSHPSENSLRVALELARSYDARVDILHVIPEVAWGEVYGVRDAGPASTLHQAAEQRSAIRLRELGRNLGQGVTWEAHTVIGNPAQAIAAHAAEAGADLIVLGTVGRTGLHRLLLGSTAEKVLRLADCDVLTISSPRETIDADRVDT